LFSLYLPFLSFASFLSFLRFLFCHVWLLSFGLFTTPPRHSPQRENQDKKMPPGQTTRRQQKSPSGAKPEGLKWNVKTKKSPAEWQGTFALSMSIIRETFLLDHHF
jgi:hypothetical protein